MPAAMEMGPHPEGTAYFCPCGRIYLKYRALASHRAKNSTCEEAARARSNRLDAEMRALHRRDVGEPEPANADAELRELKRVEEAMAVLAFAALGQSKRGH